MERVTLLKETGEFVDGHPIAKSPNSAYRLASSFVHILKAPEDQLEDAVGAWIGAEAIRQRLELQARMAVEASRKVDKKHAALIKATVGVYAKTFLPDYEVLYIDDRDGDRIPDEAQKRLDDAGIELRLGDAMPDVLLWRPGTTSFWAIEAVTSDGEVDLHKVSQVEKCLQRTMEDPVVGFTTAYRTWRDVARRQGKHKNLAPESYLWIQEDPSRHFLVETFQRQDHYHFVLR